MKTITKITTALVLLIAIALTANAATYVLTASDVTMSGGEIMYYNNSIEKDIEIPETIGGVTVTSIRREAFYRKFLTSVTIPNRVTSIGENAFGNNYLTSVTIPNSVTSIGDNAFDNNYLTSVTIGNSVTSIGNYAFRNNALTSVTIPNSVTFIGNYSFRNNALTSVTIGNSVTIIGYHAFSFNKLTSVTIPNSITFIAGRAFLDNSLTSVTIGNSVISIGSEAFGNNSLTSVTIPNSVTSIAGRAFYNNSLTSVTISNSVTSIGDNAFGNNSLTSVTIPNSVTSIGDYAFSKNALTSVTISNSVTSIGAWAFSDNSLTSIALPADVIGFENEHWETNGGRTVTSITNFYEGYRVVGVAINSITYNNAGTKNAAANPATYNKESADITLALPNDSTGYTFGGWFTDAAFADTVSTPAIVTGSTGNKEFYAKWSIKQFTVTFVDHDGTTELKAVTIYYGNDATAPTAPARSGYAFTGWDVVFTNVTSNLTVTAQYSVINSITYNNAGTKNAAANPATYTKESADITLASPNDSTAYIFGGWYTDAAFADTISTPAIATGSTGNKEFYAKWSIKQFTVTFVDHDRTTELATETVDYGNDATAPADPTRTGYDFTAWDIAFTNVTSNLTVTAQYSAVDYSITYNNAGTKNVTANPAIYTIESVDITLASPNDSTGYTFGGWYTNAAFADTVSTPAIATGNTGDINFYAKWSLEQFTVTFVDYDGTILKTETVDYANAATAPTDPTRTGYIFTGWDVDFSNITGDLTVTAQYSKNGVSNNAVTFVDYDGTTLKIETVEDGNAATAPTDPTRTGYTFTGWDVDFSNITGDLTVTAQYSKNGVNNYTVTFIDHDGTTLKTESVEDGNAATAPTDPTRTGYTFSGWDADFSNITSDLTVTAQYSKNGVNNYTVTFIDHDGTTLKTESVEDGNAATAPTDPTRTGYTFSGWDADFSNITSDLTVTAQYTQDINGINSHHLNSFSIYPNPTTGHVILTGLDEAEFIAITLLNSTGKVIEKKSFYIQGQYDFEIEGQAGLYYLQIADKNSTSTHKIIKQ